MNNSSAILRMMLIVMLLVVPHRHAVAEVIGALAEARVAESADARLCDHWDDDFDVENDECDVEPEPGGDVNGESAEVSGDADEAVIDAAPSAHLSCFMPMAALPPEMRAQSGPMQATRPPQR